MLQKLFNFYNTGQTRQSPKRRWEYAGWETAETAEPNPRLPEIKLGWVDRTLDKTMKFRVVTLFTTLGITWMLTGNPVTSVGLTAIQQSTNTVVYYFFEKNDKSWERPLDN